MAGSKLSPLALYAAGLTQIKKAALKVARADTASVPAAYEDLKARKALPSKLYLHCAAMAAVVQQAMGGHIVTGRVHGVQHYWNRLPDGQEVDLTSCQFGGDGFSALKAGRKVPPRSRLNPRFMVFADRIRKEIAK